VNAQSALPPNPYSRQPVRVAENLAGRAREQREIQYYLNLTAEGQNPHLALIGTRGVGKSSLLNASATIAERLGLLPVRLALNENKVRSSAIFWHDLYAALVPAMADAGAWGGPDGPIHDALFRMLFAGDSEADKAVLKLPYALARSNTTLAEFYCPDALIVRDLGACTKELARHSIHGIAFLVDEADCLSRNVPLLQMLRNVFQSVERCSLVFAGTDAVFPALSEVFSPIPRQFHRIDVKPFARWTETRDLVQRPLTNDIAKSIAPSTDTVQELHTLCGGDPAEVQLYCHHMYRAAEAHPSDRMSLSPGVFRAVLREYRANTPANVESILQEIERLPDELLFESLWVSRRSLQADQNIRVALMRRELHAGQILDENERQEIERKITDGYARLFGSGISESPNRLQLAGAPLTAGFWKSFVKAERGEDWWWDDRSFAELLRSFVGFSTGKAIGANFFFETRVADPARTALEQLRAGTAVGALSEGVFEMVSTALMAHEESITYAMDLDVAFESPAGKTDSCWRFFENLTQPLTRESVEKHLRESKRILDSHDISVAILDCNRWQLPTHAELHRLGRISGVPVPSVFGPTQSEQAVAAFQNGNVDEAASVFAAMVSDKDEPGIRNNLAFCELLLNRFDTARINAGVAAKQSPTALHLFNESLAQYLCGDTASARETCLRARRKLEEDPHKHEQDILFVHTLAQDGSRVRFHSDLPLGVAIHLTLNRLGAITLEECLAQLNIGYPSLRAVWAPLTPEPDDTDSEPVQGAIRTESKV
jgi:hypothetical protein